MINAAELRLGNRLSDMANLEINLIVYKIEDGIITCGDKDFDYPYLAETLKPIPLTEDILLKCGFEKKGSEGWFHKDYIAFDLGDEGVDELDHRYLMHPVEISINTSSFRANIYNTMDDEQGATPKVKIKTLHQLQNLYFALTGQELEVNL